MAANTSTIGKVPIQSTAGAVPVRTEKGMAMEKVKVTRYVAGKRPEYAASESSASSAESDSEEEIKKHASSSSSSRRRGPEKPIDRSSQALIDQAAMNDRRLRRLMQSKGSRDDEIDEDEKYSRHRQIHEPEIVSKSRAEEDGSDFEEEKPDVRPTVDVGRRRKAESSDEAEEDDLSDDELERRRAMIKARSTMKEKEEELLGKVEESGDESEAEEESEYEEETDSEEDAVQRLKPVFVRKRDRVTLQDTEKEQQKLRDLELQRKIATEERKRQSTKLVEDLVRLEVEQERKKVDDDHIDLNSVNTDDENEELAYEAWKLRELKRVKRTKDEREAHEREKSEIERIHNMSEEERRAFLRANPKIITNKQQKGKYKFLQKYYHRGVFFLGDEDDVYKRNFAEPTLEDHFDKSILPKVMQVKDFGKAGRTKWTHLVAEDTTDFQSAWVADTAQNLKFFQKHGAGIKDVFERPAMKKRKKN